MNSELATLRGKKNDCKLMAILPIEKEMEDGTWVRSKDFLLKIYNITHAVVYLLTLYLFYLSMLVQRRLTDAILFYKKKLF